jgi:DNA repair exonuclease SbcCD ATPase subunit
MRNIVFGKWTLTNFKAHTFIEIDYSWNGLITITGNNGAGKSSLAVDSLCWALYGQDSKGREGDNVVNVREGKNTCVSGEFSIDEDNYVVKRYRKHAVHKNKVFLFKNSNDISLETEKSTTRLIEQIFMPRQLFLNCVTFSSISTLKHSDQKEILDKILNLEVYDEYFGKISDSISDVTEQIRLKERDVPVIEKDIELKIEKIKDLEIEIEENKNSTNKTLKICLDEYKEKTEKSKNISITREEIEKIEKDHLVVAKRSSELEEKIKSIEERRKTEIENEKSKISEDLKNAAIRIKSEYSENLLDPLKNRKQELEKLEKDVENRKLSEISEIKDRINKAREAFSEKLESEKKPFSDEISRIDAKIKENSTNIENLEELIKKDEKTLSDMQTKFNEPVKICSLCKQELKTTKSIENIEIQLEKLRENIRKNENEIKRLNQSSRELEIEKSNFENKLSDVVESFGNKKIQLESKMKTSLEESETKFKNELNQITNELEEIDKQIKGLNDELEEKIKKEKESESLRYSEAKRLLNEKFDEEELGFKTELEKIKVDEEYIEKILSEKKKQLEEKENLIKTAEDKKNEGISEKNKFDEFRKKKIVSIEDTEKQIAILEENLSQIEESTKGLKRELEILNIWKKAFSDTGIRDYILDECIPILNEKSVELCSLVGSLKVRFDSQKMTKTKGLKNSFSITALQTDNLSTLNDFSAGEERMVDIVVFLCIRNLLEVMQNDKMNIILLDEALDKLDPNSAAIVVQMIRNLTADHCVVLITHTFREYIESDISIVL